MRIINSNGNTIPGYFGQGIVKKTDYIAIFYS